MQRKSLIQVLFAFIVFALSTGEAIANAISPILNFVQRDNWLPATIVASVIIVIETILLCRFARPMGILHNFWRCLVLNIGSSLAGSLVLMAVQRDSVFVDDGLGLILAMFCLTLITEVPTIRFLYRGLTWDWYEAIVTGFKLNMISYALVIVVEGLFLVGWFSFSDRRDEKTPLEWQNPEMLEETSGVIYSTEKRIDGTFGLRYFTVGYGTWTSITNHPPIDPFKWDVARSTTAFIGWPEGGTNKAKLFVCSITNLANCQVFNLAGLIEAGVAVDPNDWSGIVDIALSPDASKAAVLWRVNGVAAQRDNSSYYDLGAKCSLLVLNLDTGKIILKGVRPASDRGLCWFGDSEKLLFSSFKDQSLYNTPKSQIKGNHGLGYGLAEGKQFEAALYVFDTLSGQTEFFAEGSHPALASASKQFLVQQDVGFNLLDEAGAVLKSFHQRRTEYSKPAISPEGRFILMNVRKNNPLRAQSFLTIIRLNDPNQRHLLLDNVNYRYRWVPEF